MEKIPGRPLAGEFAPIAQRYVELVVEDDARQTLAHQHEKTLAWIRSVGEDYASIFTYAPGKWTIKQILGHITDAERIFAYRALRLARQDRTPLPGFEQDDYVATANSGQRNLSNLIAEFSAVRQASLALFQDLPDEAWMQRAEVSGQSITVRGILSTMAGHELHHFKILQERYQPA
jgi:uncharacterized damage-inducible protein DinB